MGNQDSISSMIERAGKAARIAVPRYAVSTYSQHDGRHVVWEKAECDWPVVFSGSHEECEAWVSAYVGRAAIEAMREPTEEMVNAGRARFIRSGISKEVWSILIDAALKD